MIHIIERALTHILMSGSVYLIGFFALHWAMRKNAKRTMQILPGLLCAALIGWREAYDVAQGQPLLKAYTDYASWLIGMALAIWGLARYRKVRGV